MEKDQPFSEFIDSINIALKKLTGYKRREYAAEICIKYFDGSPSKMERSVNVGREMVKLALKEHYTGIRCLEAFSCRGRKKRD